MMSEEYELGQIKGYLECLYKKKEGEKVNRPTPSSMGPPERGYAYKVGFDIGWSLCDKEFDKMVNIRWGNC